MLVRKLRWYLLLIPIFCLNCRAESSGLDKISAYAGRWKIETTHFETAFSKAGSDSTTLKNECWRSAGFYVCDQIVNGDSKALVIFTYDEKTGTYASNNVTADGVSRGGGKLLITGSTWTFPWEKESEGKTVYFRVVNIFTSPDAIEYRQEFSRDKVQWTVMAKGSEKKLSSP